MKIRVIALLALPLLSVGHSAFADEAGIGRDNDIPDAPPPSDPAPAETSQSLLQQLLESFDLTGDIEQ